MIVTFYSFKGGVGRSMALVNVAEILADRGYRVIACDWDLEAPGLERYFTSREIDDSSWESTLEQLIATPGLIDLISDYRDTLSNPAMAANTEPGDHYAMLGEIQVRRPSTVVVPVSQSLPHPRSGWVRLLTAGRRDGIYQQSYAEVIRSFDWEEFYNRWAGGSYIEFLRRDLVNTPNSTGAADILLVDSRTGVTEQGGICTHHLADLVLLLSAANDANLAGVQWMAEQLTDPRLTALRNQRPIEVLPVAARIEQGAQKEELVDFRKRFVSKFRSYTERAKGVGLNAKAFELATEIPYMAYYSFTERVVARESEDQREENLYKQYMNLADAIVDNGVARNLLRDIGARRDAIEQADGRARTQTRRHFVYVSMATRPSEKAEVLVDGLFRAGMDVQTRGVWPATWMHASRFVILREGDESDSQRAEIAAAVRQSLVRGDLGVVQIDADEIPGATNANFFEALAEEIATSDASLALQYRVRHPGAQPLGEEHAAILFGRDAELAHVASQWPNPIRWLHIRGDSGVGKTSFVQAGLIPLIRRGEIHRLMETTEIAIVRAGPDIRELIAPLLERADADRLVLVIEDCDRMPDLIPAMALANSNILLVTTSRTQLPGSGQAVSVVLPGLRFDGALQALNAATAFAHMTWESGLPERIICDLADPTGGVSEYTSDATVDPALLGWLIADLVDPRFSRVTHKQYDEGGCIGERLSRLASNALTGIGDPARAQQLLGRLVTPEGDPRAIPLTEDDMVERMAELRLIRIGTDIRLRHPLLGRWWPALRRFASSQAKELQTENALAAARALWEATNRSGSALPRGKALAYLDKAAADEEARTFVKVAKWMQIVRIAGAVVVALLLVAFGIVLRNATLEYRRTQELRAEADAIATRSLKETKDPVRALVLAIAAGEKIETQLVRKALGIAIHTSRLRAVFKPEPNPWTARLSTDGKTLITVGGGRVEKWDAASGRFITSEFLPPISAHFDIQPDNSAIAYITDNSEVGVVRFDTTQGYRLPGARAVAMSPTRYEMAVAAADALVMIDDRTRTVTMVERNIRGLTDVAFTPDGEAIIAISSTGFLSVWTRLHDQAHRPIRAFVQAHRGGISSFAINTSGDRVITTGTHDRHATMWRLDPSAPNAISFANWGLTTTVPVTVPVQAFGDNDKRVLLVADDGIHVWPAVMAGSGIHIRAKESFRGAAFDARQPRLVISSSFDPLLYTLKPDGTADTIVLHPSAGTFSDLSFSADGSQIVSVSNDVRLWWANDVPIPEDFQSLLEAAHNRLPITLTNAERESYLEQQ
jgi:hypothetical protein